MASAVEWKLISDWWYFGVFWLINWRSVDPAPGSGLGKLKGKMS